MWDEDRVLAVADAYRLHFVADHGEPRQSAVAEQHWWAWEAVERGIAEGSAPVELLDALVRQPDGDGAFRAYVAAGPIEDALRSHPETYADGIAALCRSEGLWADTIGLVWLDPSAVARLPDELRRRLPQPPA